MNKKFLHTISTSLPLILVRYIEKKGFDTNILLNNIGIDQSTLANPETRLTAEQFDTFWNVAVEMVSEQNFGILFAGELANAWRGNNFIFNMMMNSSNVGEALERLIKYHDIVADAVRPMMDIRSTGVHIFWEYFGPTFKMPDQLGEGLLVLYTKMLRRLTDNQLVLLEVNFTSSPPKNLDIYNSIFQAPLQFGKPQNKLLLDKQCLDHPLFLADSMVLSALEQLAKKRMEELFSENTVSKEVGRMIGKTLLAGKEINLDIIAKEFAMSPRNLQLKLKGEGVSYQEILDDFRKTIALDSLKEPTASFSDLAFLLGYSDQSAFNHAFKRWTGKTPKQCRS